MSDACDFAGIGCRGIKKTATAMEPGLRKMKTEMTSLTFLNTAVVPYYSEEGSAVAQEMLGHAGERMCRINGYYDFEGELCLCCCLPHVSPSVLAHHAFFMTSSRYDYYHAQCFGFIQPFLMLADTKLAFAQFAEYEEVDIKVEAAHQCFPFGIHLWWSLLPAAVLRRIMKTWRINFHNSMPDVPGPGTHRWSLSEGKGQSAT